MACINEVMTTHISNEQTHNYETWHTVTHYRLLAKWMDINEWIIHVHVVEQRDNLPGGH